MVAFTRKHLFDALESGHKLCHYFRTETLARYIYLIQYRLIPPLITNWYIFYFLQSPIGQKKLIEGGSGVGRPNLNAPKIDSIQIPLPALEEQREIVSEIERNLSIINHVERTIQSSLSESDSLRQSILKRAFEGKLVSQDPNDEPASVLLEMIKAEKASRAAEGKKGKTLQRRSPKRTIKDAD